MPVLLNDIERRAAQAPPLHGPLTLMIGFIFPGQASQFVGMGAQLAVSYPAAAEVISRADEVLGFALSKLMFAGPMAELTATEVAQPALLTVSVATLRVLEEGGLQAGIVAGHSLGEYSALVAAGALDFPAALELVRQRGLLMARAGEQAGGTMAAVIGLDTAEVERVVERAAREGNVVVVANYNSPGQIVISGTEAGVRRAGELGKEAGARGVVPLNVSGAFHSPLMAAAAAELSKQLLSAPLTDAKVPLVSNVDAVARTDANAIRAALARQLTSSVLWEKSIRAMLEAGIESFVEVGPKDVLTKMMRRTAPEVPVQSTSAPADIEHALKQLSREGK